MYIFRCNLYLFIYRLKLRSRTWIHIENWYCYWSIHVINAYANVTSSLSHIHDICVYELVSMLSFLCQCLSHFSHIGLCFRNAPIEKHPNTQSVCVCLDGWCALFMCLFPAPLSRTHHCSCTFALCWLRGNGFVEKTSSSCLLWI